MFFMPGTPLAAWRALILTTTCGGIWMMRKTKIRTTTTLPRLQIPTTSFMFSRNQTSNNHLGKPDGGFSLLEMAIVLAIVSLLMAGLLPSLTSPNGATTQN